MDEDERILAHHFRALHDDSEHLAPGFDAVLAARTRRRPAWLPGTALAASAATLVLMLAWLVWPGPAPTPVESSPFSPPPDFLLTDARTDYLARAPGTDLPNKEKTIP